MRILLASHGYPPELSGGTERHTRSLAEGLVARGHEVTVLAGTLEWSDSLRLSERVMAGVRVVRVHRDDAYYERWERLHHEGVSRLVGELIDEWRPDVMHVHHWLRLTSDLVAQASMREVPTLVTLHDFTATCPALHRVLPDSSWCAAPIATANCTQCSSTNQPDNLPNHRATELLDLRHARFRRELELASRILALSQSHADRLSVQLGSDSPTVDPHPFCAGASLGQSPWPRDPLPLRIMTLGRLSRQKGLHVLLEACAKARHSDQLELHLHGTLDPDESSQELTARALPVPVYWHGAYRSEELEREPYHLAVLPSLYHETYGLVLDEVRMLGLPALVSDRGAYAERLGTAGATFRAGDASDLARQLDQLVEDPERLARMRSNIVPPPSFGAYLDFVEAQYSSLAINGGNQRSVS